MLRVCCLGQLQSAAYSTTEDQCVIHLLPKWGQMSVSRVNSGVGELLIFAANSVRLSGSNRCHTNLLSRQHGELNSTLIIRWVTTKGGRENFPDGVK